MATARYFSVNVNSVGARECFVWFFVFFFVKSIM